MREQLDRLRELGFLQPETEPGQRTYLFKHSSYHEVTYATLTAEQTNRYHRAVGAALEKRRPEAIERLAYHYSRSDDTAKRLTYLEQAAQESKRKYANVTTLGYYAEALALEERWTWRRSQAQTLHVLGRREEEKASLAQAAIELALADSRDKGDLIGQARCLSHLGLIARRQGNYGQAKARYNQAMIHFNQKQNLSERETQGLIRLYNGLGTVYRQQGELTQARQCHQEALALSRRRGNRFG